MRSPVVYGAICVPGVQSDSFINCSRAIMRAPKYRYSSAASSVEKMTSALPSFGVGCADKRSLPNRSASETSRASFSASQTPERKQRYSSISCPSREALITTSIIESGYVTVYVTPLEFSNVFRTSRTKISYELIRSVVVSCTDCIAVRKFFAIASTSTGSDGSTVTGRSVSE